MKLTRLISTPLTSADCEALRRMCSLLSGRNLAYINDRVAVDLDTEETDPATLAAMACDSMAEARRDMYAVEYFAAGNGLDAIRFSGKKVYVFSRPDDPQHSLSSLWTLLQMGHAACASGEVQAIVTCDGTPGDLCCAAEDVDPTAPPRDYMQELGLQSPPSEPASSIAVDPLSLPDDQIDWEQIIDFDDDPSAPPPDPFNEDAPFP